MLIHLGKFLIASVISPFSLRGTKQSISVSNKVQCHANNFWAVWLLSSWTSHTLIKKYLVNIVQWNIRLSWPNVGWTN